MKFEEFYKARDIIEELLTKDLFGPVKENEIIDELPTQYYSMGILHPKESQIDKLDQINDSGTQINNDSNMRDNTSGDSFENYDEGVALSNMYNPSSLAMSTTLRPNANNIKVKVQYGKYELIDDQDTEEANIKLAKNTVEESLNTLNGKDNTQSGSSDLKKNKYKKDKWRRKSYSVVKSISLDASNSKIEQEIEENLKLEIYIQKVFFDKSKTITIALLNTNEAKKSQKVNDKNSFYQVQMQVSSMNENETIFIPKRMNIELSEDPEIKNLNMLYKHIENYAVGHGCAVDTVINNGKCYEIHTKIIPNYEINQMKPSVRTNTKMLQMKFLSEGSKEDIISNLKQLVDSYNSWIDGLISEKGYLDNRFNIPAEENIKLCKETSNRINQCIEMLKDDTILKAFQLANKAMLNQRISYLNRENKKIKYEKITWYPFQLAFILQEIPSIADQNDQYRNIVDLLWFPTGGGKTEAYLGASAFTIFLRRLLDKDNAGVTIIMRYTLRLLTIQQFERAAALICACESIRKQENMGNEEISIGLFVGGGLTPNTISKADENLHKIQSSGMKSVREGNPCQILKCPVCGSEVNPNNYKIRNDHMKINCSNKECEYHDGLPIYLIDEDIYHFKPTLIISTVDKFARMTWEPKIRKIFGIDTNYDPPQLIIQDELHLIAGPLGTVTGLYETAIDYFCHKDNIGPKIIASTATIRNAKSQILSLYARKHRQFPPQGIDIRDSYFAEEASKDERPGRKYIGILSPNKSATTVLVRVYACLQFASRYLKDLGFKDKVIDNYWTITGYFNSLRELGGAVIQVHDDVQDRYKFLHNKKFSHVSPSFTSKQNQDYLEELTSRKNQSEITKALEDLSRTYETGEAFDYVLASNMISVGVDIGRLGIMSVTGQPKSNSEYIQASSRVGRSNPGLVVTVYSASKSRDRSHYEQFNNYHSAIYKYVEATSLTPFSARARERALHAVYISMCRQLFKEYRYNTDAKNYNTNDSRLNQIEEFILKRAEIILQDVDEYNEVIEDLEYIKLDWVQAIDSNDVIYDNFNTPGTPLIKKDTESLGVFATLNSMRNVDKQSNVFFEED